MSEDLGSRDKCPVYLPKIFPVVPDARGGLLSTTCTFLAGETRRRAYSSETCLFRIRLQFAHIWTSLLPPHPPPSPFIWESTAKKTRFPKIASSLKVSRVFNSEKHEVELAQWCLGGRPSSPVYNPLHLCTYQDHQQRVALLILQLCHPGSDSYRVLLRPSYPWGWGGGRGPICDITNTGMEVRI